MSLWISPNAHRAFHQLCSCRAFASSVLAPFAPRLVAQLFQIVSLWFPGFAATDLTDSTIGFYSLGKTQQEVGAAVVVTFDGSFGLVIAGGRAVGETGPSTRRAQTAM